jgi:Flp pilus assembly CpaE family ATPase
VKHRSRLVRVYSILGAVPFPQGGSHTATIASHTGYTEDMRQVLPVVQEVLLGMMATQRGNAALREDEDYRNPDALLDALEAWVRLRQGQQWASSSFPVSPLYFYKKNEESDE